MRFTNPTCRPHQLANRPDLRRQLVEHPDMIPGAVEELLRWETPPPAVFRVAAAEGGVEVLLTSGGEPESGFEHPARKAAKMAIQKQKISPRKLRMGETLATMPTTGNHLAHERT